MKSAQKTVNHVHMNEKMLTKSSFHGSSKFATFESQEWTTKRF